MIWYNSQKYISPIIYIGPQVVHLLEHINDFDAFFHTNLCQEYFLLQNKFNRSHSYETTPHAWFDHCPAVDDTQTRGCKRKRLQKHTFSRVFYLPWRIKNKKKAFLGEFLLP